MACTVRILLECILFYEKSSMALTFCDSSLFINKIIAIDSCYPTIKGDSIHAAILSMTQHNSFTNWEPIFDYNC